VTRARQDAFDPCARETFLAAKLDWRELDDPRHQRVLAWHRELIALRRRARSLAAGALLESDVFCSEKESWLLARRGPYTIAAHLGSTPALLPVDTLAQTRIVLACGAGHRLTSDGLQLGPNSFAVIAPL
jgi:maltooligosyltrehalose trehalohydrolase